MNEPYSRKKQELCITHFCTINIANSSNQAKAQFMQREKKLEKLICKPGKNSFLTDKSSFKNLQDSFKHVEELIQQLQQFIQNLEKTHY